ncbi:TVP38/TMEM64 family protein [Clostridium cylindrosporum]|uniref:TVP38/TMEM64 family membrane protein n=1 Tax=Clostridium cylindrosporum DSM 605 TaxID=1121307 RepID=A0A0J8D8A0_CLOCY|nr:VTT domain-containing protein [Clostridium cylindrosporum]KMT22285.1 SNARE associated golgi protein [Clostridium cylindrosporum DSM 605]
MFSVNDMVEVLRSNSTIAIPISLLVSIIISLIGVLPSVFVTGANIVFFGPINGFLISLLGEVIGAYITFKVYRLGFKKRIEKITDKYKLISKIASSSGKWVGLLIFQGRLIPFVPSGLVTLAASISSVNASVFNIATIFGKAPSIALEALVSYDVINIQENFIRLIITIIGLLLLMITIRKK